MGSYVFTRMLLLLASLWAASMVVFFATEIAPGDPAQTMLGMNAAPDTVAALRSQLGLDVPLSVRYVAWIGGFFTGDMGISYTYRVPVADLIAERLTVSLPLALIALMLAVVIALPMGLFAAARTDAVSGKIALGTLQLGIAVPNFWLAMMLVLFLALRWRLFPAGGFPGWADPREAVTALILPAVALAVPQGAILARVLRVALLETLSRDYIRTARAKGASQGRILIRHALRNAMVPVSTIMAMQFSVLLAGAIIIENVFALPGLGRLIFQAIAQRDMIVVESAVMVLVVAVILISFVTDMIYALIDPRLRRRG